MKNSKTIECWNSITLCYDAQNDLNYSNTEERNKMLSSFKKKYWDRTLFFPDSKSHTSNIAIVENQESLKKFDKISNNIYAISNHDWIIIHNTKEVDQCVSSLQVVWDCPIISFYNKDSVMWTLHSWWRGTAGNILWKCLNILIMQLCDKINDTQFFVSPMILDNFEFWVNTFNENFSDLVKKYSLDPNAIFKPINQEKWNLFLKPIFESIFSHYNIPKENITYSDINTYDKNSQFPSHRLYTDWQQSSDTRFGVLLTWNNDKQS